MNLQEAIEQAKNQASMFPAQLIRQNTEELKNLPLIGETTYSLNRSRTKFVCVGLGPDGLLLPVVKISGTLNNQCVVFDKKEWNDLLENEANIMNYFQNNYQDVQWAPVKIGEKTLSFLAIGGRKVIKLETGVSEVWLGWESVMQLWNMVEIINYQLEILAHAAFAEFYKNIIDAVAEMIGDVKVNIMNIIAPLKDTKAENVLYMMEMVQLVPNKIIVDIEIAKCVKM